jgi:hypothetical protein
MLSENLLYDPHYNSLGLAAQNLFVRMLIKTDDYGIIPIDEYGLSSMLNLPAPLRKNLSNLLVEIETAGVGFRFDYQDKDFFFFKRERFDEYQSYLIQKRTKSEYLRFTKDFMEGDGFQELLGNSKKFPKVTPVTHKEYKVKSREYEVESIKQKDRPGNVEEVAQYMAEIEVPSPEVEAAAYWDHFNGNGWKVGKGGLPMKDWKATVRTWKRNGEKYANNRNSNGSNRPGSTRSGGSTTDEDARRTFANTPIRPSK